MAIRYQNVLCQNKGSFFLYDDNQQWNKLLWEILKSLFLEVLKAEVDKALGNLSDLEIRASFKFGAALSCGFDWMMRWSHMSLPSWIITRILINPGDYSVNPSEKAALFSFQMLLFNRLTSIEIQWDAQVYEKPTVKICIGNRYIDIFGRMLVEGCFIALVSYFN